MAETSYGSDSDDDLTETLNLAAAAATKNSGGANTKGLTLNPNRDVLNSHQVHHTMGDVEEGLEGIPKFATKASIEAQLRELLCNLLSIEIKLCSYASKKFIRLLKSKDGGDLLHQYVLASSNCAELMDAWNLRRGKPGMSYIFLLVAIILDHPDGKYNPNEAGRISISKALDKFAQSIISEKLFDVYEELNSKEGKRQSAALRLMASIVRRGSGLASEVAKTFDFKLPVLPRLAEFNRKGMVKKGRHSTRKPFIGFLISFLEVGKPGLVSWVLQQKEIFSGILRGLGNDDEETVSYVLCTLRDRVLIKESLVGPALRSALFGSVTLEQLASICGRKSGGIASVVAYDILIMVCTDPCNGLMPDMNRNSNPSKGNPKRLLDLMKKLKATEVDYHKNLLLATVNARPFFGSAYIDEFPYNLEDQKSPMWFNVVSFAADLIRSVHSCLSFASFNFKSHDPLSLNSPDVQCVMKCACPRPFSRSVINKGLLHSNFLVKHGTLRLLLELLNLLDSLLGAVQNSFYSSNLDGWVSLKKEIQNEVQMSLPDPQVLLSLVSSLNSGHKSSAVRLKRAAVLDNGIPRKKQKTSLITEDADIIVGGIGSVPDDYLPEQSEEVNVPDSAGVIDNVKDCTELVTEIWGLNCCSMAVLKDVETYFYAKLLDALKIYHRIMPSLFEGSFDFFKILPVNPLKLPAILQQPLLSLLIEHIGWCPKRGIPIRPAPLMYKHLHQFIELLLYSPINDIKDQAYVLAQAAILSTGAFEKNSWEIGSWFLFLPGYGRDSHSIESQEVEVFHSLSSIVVSFLCDAISSIGNNLFKYWDRIRCCAYQSQGIKDVSPDFSPLAICVLEKCLRLLNSESRTFSLPEKTMVSLYVSNTLSYLLQTQVRDGFLCSLINILLSEKFEDHCSTGDGSHYLCEWRPLKNLLLFSKNIMSKQTCSIFSIDGTATYVSGSFFKTLSRVRKTVNGGHDDGLVGITKAFSFSMMCATLDELLQNFPSVMSISGSLFSVPSSILSSILFLERGFLDGILRLWPEMFSRGLEMFVALVDSNGRNDNPYRSLSPKEDTSDPMDPDSVAFGLFLKQVPFHILFSVLLKFDGLHLFEQSRIQLLLLTKMSELVTTHFISSLSLVLFSIDQIQSSYRIKPSGKLEKVSEICYVLLERLLAQFLDARMSSQHIKDVAVIISSHPAVTVSLASSLSLIEEFTDADFHCNAENFLLLCRQRVHSMDRCALKLLTTISEWFSAICYGEKLKSDIDDCANEKILKAFHALLGKLILEFRVRFDLCMGNSDLAPLVPTLYTLHSLIDYISPFQLLDLVDWMFVKINLVDCSDSKSFSNSALSIALCIGGRTFEILSSYLQQSSMKTEPYDRLEEETSYIALFERIYFKLCELSLYSQLDLADLCLLRAVNAIYSCSYLLRQRHFLPLSMAMLRMVINTPVDLLYNCIHQTSTVRAKLLVMLLEKSPHLMPVFGKLFSDLLNIHDNLMQEPSNKSLSEEDFMILLPAALSFLNSNFLKFGDRFLNYLKVVSSFYSMMLLDGLVNWKSFVSGHMFQVDCGEFLPSSMEELLRVASDSLLGKTTQMLRYYFAFSADSLDEKRRLELFDSICPPSSSYDDLLECNVAEIGSYSLKQSLNFANRIIAKISICRMLLFPNDNLVRSDSKEADGNEKVASSRTGYSKEDLSRTRLLSILVHAWQLIVKKFSLSLDNSQVGKGSSCILFKLLESHILKTITELTANMQSILVQMHSLPFVEQIVRSSLLYRFEDPATLEMLRSVLYTISECTSSHVNLQLLLDHSHFLDTMHSISTSSDCSQSGVFFRPPSSILRSIVDSYVDPNASSGKNSDSKPIQLEVIKLLRCLYHFNYDAEINSKELLYLLMSSYGATLSEIDLEIYSLMREIEAAHRPDSGNMTEMDFLWGPASVKLRKERLQEGGCINETEEIEERRRRQFRENLPVDPKLCTATVLYFPYDRTKDVEPYHGKDSQQKSLRNGSEPHFAKVDKTQQYDPVFILHFSVHSLSMGYLEPLEFASLGLLAVVFVSISSPCIEIRKLGYDALGKFKNAVEKHKNRKDIMQFRLLLTYLQNGIEEEWQQIPSIISIFAAEASFILLNPSNDNYSTISKLLMCSPKVNLKGVPLFQTFFWSSSTNFRTERSWILRLLYAGVNLDYDGQIFMKCSIVEPLLSFCVSPLSDNGSKELVLLIVKRAVKLHKMVIHLVEHCGLLSWLSSILSICSRELSRDHNTFTRKLSLILEVVNDVVASSSIIEWLKNYALEQLSEFSSHLHKLLVNGSSFMKRDVALVNQSLQILVSTLEISRKRGIYQPHFTPSLEDLFQMYEAIDSYNDGTVAEFALRVILMSTPSRDIFHMDPRKLSKFIMWSIYTALLSDSTKKLHLHDHSRSLILLEAQHGDGSLISKLLHWLTASVIQGSFSWKSNNLDYNFTLGISNLETVRSLLESIKEGYREKDKDRFGCQEILASAILSLQQLAINSTVQLTYTLCLLLLYGVSHFTGSDFLCDNEYDLESILSRIWIPAEANAVWRWSFDQPWEGLSLKPIDLESLDELQACQSLLVIFSNVLGKKPLDKQILLFLDHGFQWERSIMGND